MFYNSIVNWIESNNFERKNAAIACRSFKDYDKVAEVVADIHSEHDLKLSKIVKTVTDNGSNIVKTFDVFGKPETIQNEHILHEPEEDNEEQILLDESNDEDDESLLLLQAFPSFPGVSSDLESDCILPGHERCATHTLHLIARKRYLLWLSITRANKNSTYDQIFQPDDLLTTGGKHDVEVDPHIIAPDPFFSGDNLDVVSPSFHVLTTYGVPNTMDHDDPVSGLNVRLRPRKLTISYNQGIDKTSNKLEDATPGQKNNIQPPTGKDDEFKVKLDGQSKLLCLYCDKKFSFKKSLSKHVTNSHSLSSQDQNFTLKCLFCSHYESNSFDIFKHMIETHHYQYFACLNCQIRFPSTSKLNQHKINSCDNQNSHDIPYRSKLRRRCNPNTSKRGESIKNISNNEGFSKDFNSVVISCELKPSHDQDAADIENNITTNLILPSCKNIVNNSIIDKNAVIVLDNIQWNKKITSNFTLHNNDADQILSRLGVVHRSPRTSEYTKRDSYKNIDETTKFEKCFDTSFYSKVSSNVQENLLKFLDGSFNRFNSDNDNVIKTRKSKNSVIINTVEGFPILLSKEQCRRNVFDTSMPKITKPKLKWKGDNNELDRSLFPVHDQLKGDPHANNCIITLVSRLDIFTQLNMRRKFEVKFTNNPLVPRKTAKNNTLEKDLKEILESREISNSSDNQFVEVAKTYPERPVGQDDFPVSLGLMPSTSSYNFKPAVLSGEWVRPRRYVCCACGDQTQDSKALLLHISNQHPNAEVENYEVVGEQLLAADILKHLYVPQTSPTNRTRPQRGSKECTKCKKSITLEELHQHMLECAGDIPTVRRKCRYRPFGVRRRRPRLPDNRIRKQMREELRKRQTRQNKYRRPRPRRTEVGDGETIRKMLADLPAKRHRATMNSNSTTLRPIQKHGRLRSKVTSRPLEVTNNKITRLVQNIAHASRVDNERLVNKPSRTFTTRNGAHIRRKAFSTVSLKMKKPRSNMIVDNQDDTVQDDFVQDDNVHDNSVQVGSAQDDNIPDNNIENISIHNNSVQEESTNTNIASATASNNEKIMACSEINDQFSTNNFSNRMETNGNDNNIKQCSAGGTSDCHDSRRFSYNEQSKGDSAKKSTPQKVPLKHSIERLTSNTEMNDRTVRYQHNYLMAQQYIGNYTQISHHMPVGHQPLFENEAVVIKLDKPPLFNLNPRTDPYAFHKSKLNKPRKGLNDCIAMLKNKLNDPIPSTSNASQEIDLQSPSSIPYNMPDNNEIQLSENLTEEETSYNTVILPAHMSNSCQFTTLPLDLSGKSHSLHREENYSEEATNLCTKDNIRSESYTTLDLSRKATVLNLEDQRQQHLENSDENVANLNKSVPCTSLDLSVRQIPREQKAINTVPETVNESPPNPVLPTFSNNNSNNLVNNSTTPSEVDNTSSENNTREPDECLNVELSEQQAAVYNPSIIIPEFKIVVEGSTEQQVEATNTDNEINTSNILPHDLELLPREIVNILGTMSAQHRNSLLNVLPQVLVKTVNHLKLVVDSNSTKEPSTSHEIATQTSSTSEEVCPPEFINVDTERYLIDPCTGAITERPNTELESTETLPVIEDNVVDLTADDCSVPMVTIKDEKPKINLNESLISNIASTSHFDLIPRQRVSNDQTASLRAVRIKSANDKNKSFKKTNETSSNTDTRTIENCLISTNTTSDRQDIKAPAMHIQQVSLAIQQAEVSSTQQSNCNNHSSQVSTAITTIPSHDQIVAKTKKDIDLESTAIQGCTDVVNQGLETNSVTMKHNDVLIEDCVNSASIHSIQMIIKNDITETNDMTAVKTVIEPKIIETSPDRTLLNNSPLLSSTPIIERRSNINCEITNKCNVILNNQFDDDDPEDNVSLALILKQKQLKLQSSPLKDTQCKQFCDESKNEVFPHDKRDKKRKKKPRNTAHSHKSDNKGSLSGNSLKQNGLEKNGFDCTDLEESPTIQAGSPSLEDNILHTQNITKSKIDCDNFHRDETKQLTSNEMNGNISKYPTSINETIKHTLSCDVHQSKHSSTTTAIKTKNNLTETNKCKVSELVIDITDSHDSSCHYGNSMYKEEMVLKKYKRPLEVNNTDIIDNDDIESSIQQTVRRSKRGKFTFTDTDSMDNTDVVPEVKTCVETKTPLTKKQLIFSKLQKDEENSTKSLHQDNKDILQNLLQEQSIQSCHNDNAECTVNTVTEDSVNEVQDSIMKLKRKKSTQIRQKSKKNKLKNLNTKLKEETDKDDGNGNDKSVKDKEVNKYDAHLTTKKSELVYSKESKIQMIDNVAHKYLEDADDVPVSIIKESHTKTNEVNGKEILEKLKESAGVTDDSEHTLRDLSTEYNEKPTSTLKRKHIKDSSKSKVKRHKSNDSKCKAVDKESVSKLNKYINDIECKKDVPPPAKSSRRKTRSKSAVVTSSKVSVYDRRNNIDTLDDSNDSFRDSILQQPNTSSNSYRCNATITSACMIDTSDEYSFSDDHDSTFNDFPKSKYQDIDSDDSSKSDIPLQKYVDEISRCENQTNDSGINISGCDKDRHRKHTRLCRNSRRTLGIYNNVELSNETEEEKLKSEQFMESFGFFSERKPRKSNLIATKKISETFNIIANESEDVYFTNKDKAVKKNPQNENKKSSTHTNEEESPERSKKSPTPVMIRRPRKRGRKKKQHDKDMPYCSICQKEFRRLDNLYRHQLTLFHISKLSKIEMKFDTVPYIEAPNYLVTYKKRLDKLRKLTDDINRERKRKGEEIAPMPTLADIIADMNRLGRSNRSHKVSRRDLSCDEALFLDCCELLKESHKTDNCNTTTTTTTADTSGKINSFDTLQETVTSNLETTDKMDNKSDGDVDSITAKNILESEEVRNLENDLISGLKESAQRSAMGTFENSISINTISHFDEVQIDLVQKSESPLTVEDEAPKQSDPIKETKKDDHLHNIDIFEDKFDKIKRKSRSQAVAAKNIQPALQERVSVKSRKKCDKRSKKKKGSKKKQSGKVLTKGALKGFDGIKVSIPTSDINMTGIVPPIAEQTTTKKRKKNSTKKRKEKASPYFKEVNSGFMLNQQTKEVKRALEVKEPPKQIDIYEFSDNEETNMFDYRTSTRLERFKSPNKDMPSTSKAGPSFIRELEDSQHSTTSCSDGDDFVYMSDHYLCSADESDNSLTSDFGNVSKSFVDNKKCATNIKRKDAIEKTAAVGKIFKNNAVRSVEKHNFPKADTDKTNLDQLFDSLLENEPSSSMLMNDNTERDPYLTEINKDDKSTEDTMDMMNTDCLSDNDTGVARHRARRKCTVGKQNVLAETWSSESEPDIITSARPNSVESVATVVGRKRKNKKSSGQHGIRRNRHITFKTDLNESRVNRDLNLKSARKEKSFRAEMAYRWSSIDEDESQSQPHALVEQHGWIVGDSHKKLVTMLAHAKGRNRDDSQSYVE